MVPPHAMRHAIGLSVRAAAVLQVRKYPDFTPGKGEGFGHYLFRLGTEGHTFYDAWLLAAGCIGQVVSLQG